MRRPSRRIGRMMLSLGITGFILAIALAVGSVLVGNPMLRTIAVLYMLVAVMVLCYREFRKRTYQIKKRKYSRR